LFFPYGQFNQVPARLIQEQFRQWFGQWGLPAEARLDNGNRWGGWYDLPTAFALWLLGLGLKVHFNPACQPQENGVIERSNGTGQRWAEVRQYRSVAQVQEKLNEVDEIQREYMPSVAGKSRMEAYATLRHSGRTYSRQGEEENWSLAKAEEALETYVARRKVGNNGRPAVICLCRLVVSVTLFSDPRRPRIPDRIEESATRAPSRALERICHGANQSQVPAGEAE